MEEKRKDRRLDLDVAVDLVRLDQETPDNRQMARVTITDLSSSGMGFDTAYPLEEGALYNTQITIWTKEKICTVIRIVHCEQVDAKTYHCGAGFIGLSNGDAMKINIYEMLNTEE